MEKKQQINSKELQEFIKNFVVGVNDEMNLKIIALNRILFTEEGVQRTEIEWEGEIAPPEFKYRLENELALLMTKKNEVVKAKLN